MKFRNKETKTEIEVKDSDKKRIKKLEGYPDKFEKIVELEKTTKNEESKEIKKDKQDK